MKQRLGIFTALILTLAIAGSTFAANFQASTQNNMTATKSTKTKKAVKMKKHHKHQKHHKAMKKSTMKKDTTTPPSK